MESPTPTRNLHHGAVCIWQGDHERDLGRALSVRHGPRWPLPLRASFPKDRAEVDQAPAKAEEYRRPFRDAIEKREPPHRIRELIDLYHHWAWTPKIVDRDGAVIVVVIIVVIVSIVLTLFVSRDTMGDGRRRGLRL